MVERAFGVEFVEFSCFGVGAEVGVFGEGQGGAIEAGEGVDETSEFVGDVGRIGSAEGGVEAHELVKHLGGGEAEAGFVEVIGVGGSEDFGGEGGFGGELVEPFALEKPVLVAALFPLADVVRFEVFSVVTEALDDFRIGEAVEEHLVELVADGLGKAGDFAVAAVLEGEEVCGGGSGLVVLGRKIENFRLWVHRKRGVVKK